MHVCTGPVVIAIVKNVGLVSHGQWRRVRYLPQRSATAAAAAAAAAVVTGPASLDHHNNGSSAQPSRKLS